MSKIIDFEQNQTEIWRNKKKSISGEASQGPNPLCLSSYLGRKFLSTSDPLPHTLLEQCPKFDVFFYGFPTLRGHALSYFDILARVVGIAVSRLTGNNVSGPQLFTLFPNLCSNRCLKHPVT